MARMEMDRGLTKVSVVNRNSLAIKKVSDTASNGNVMCKDSKIVKSDILTKNAFLGFCVGAIGHLLSSEWGQVKKYVALSRNCATWGGRSFFCSK